MFVKKSVKIRHMDIIKNNHYNIKTRFEQKVELTSLKSLLCFLLFYYYFELDEVFDSRCKMGFILVLFSLLKCWRSGLSYDGK